MKYARARLWLGVGACLILLGFCLSSLFIGPLKIWLQAEPYSMIRLLLLIGGIQILLFPLEWVGGYALPHRYGRTTLSAGAWLVRWLRASGIHLLYFWVNALCLMGMSSWLGLWGGLGWVLLQMLLLANLQVWLARALVPLPTEPESDKGRLVLWLSHPERAFTGGIAGLPGNEVIVMPAYWRKRFKEPVWRMLLFRRHGAINTGIHGRGFFLALTYNAILFAAAAWLGGLAGGTVEAIVNTLVYFSALSVLLPLGILTWQSREAVFGLDRWTFHQRVDADVLRQSFDQSFHLQTPWPIAPGLARLMRPLPSEAARLTRLQEGKASQGAWAATQQAWFLSWAGLNLLARTLPVQLGRPIHWVFLPVD